MLWGASNRVTKPGELVRIYIDLLWCKFFEDHDKLEYPQTRGGIPRNPINAKRLI
jgi:hypothetical protein